MNALLIRLIPSFICIFLTACSGWKPLYSPQNNQQSVLTTAMESKIGNIQISPVYSVLGQNLYNSLRDRQAKFTTLTTAPKYLLSISIGTSDTSQTTFTDGSASVTLRRYTSNYSLSHAGKSRSFTSTTATTLSQNNAPFNNTVLSVKADQQAVEILAESMWKRLSIFLNNHPNW